LDTLKALVKVCRALRNAVLASEVVDLSVEFDLGGEVLKRKTVEGSS
jgi:hypothetical protein